MFAQQKKAAQIRLETGDLPPAADMEDAMAGAKKPYSGFQGKIKGKGKKKAIIEDSLPEGEAPSMLTDYVGWLAHMKRVWRHQRKAQRTGLANGSIVHVNGKSKGGLLGSMMRMQTVSLTSHTWDILQVSEVIGRPGEFKAWLLIRDTLQSVRLRIPRQFYMNLKSMPSEQEWPSGCTVEALQRTLPRSQQVLNLLRVTTPEDKYVREESAFSLLLNRPEVDGVYELQVPLLVRAIIKLGTTCVPAAGQTLSKGLDKGFELDDLNRPGASLAKQRYLDHGRRLRYVYLYHATSDTRHLICLVLPSGRARIFVVERGTNRDMPNIERYYAEQLEQVVAKGIAGDDIKSGRGVFDYPTALKVEVSFHTAEDVAFRAASRELVSLAGQKLGPTLLVAYSPRNRSFFEDRMAAATAQFPFVMIYARSSDNAFGALGWRTPASKRMVQHYLRISAHMRNQIQIADRFDVPVCNLEQDEALFCADLDFARRLTKADMLLWWSPAPRPDLGGRESDNNAPQEDVVAPEISRPGCYTTACLEIELRDLVVDAVLQSAMVYELEGAEGASVGFTEVSHTLDEYSKGTANAGVILGDDVLPTQTFAIIKAMVKNWWTDSGKADGASSRKVLDHFWRWISSPSAKLFDPAIYRFVHGLMRKTFSQLIAEFRRLGAEVIFGDFSRLCDLLCTEFRFCSS